MNVGSVFATLTAKTDDFKKKFNDAGQSLEKFGSAGKRMQDQFRSLGRQKELLVAQMIKLEQAGKSNTNTYLSMQNRLDGLNDKLATSKMKMGEFADSSSGKVKKLQDSFSGLTQTKINEFTAGVGDAFKKVGEIATISGIAIVGFATVVGGLAIKTTGDFQTQMLKTKAVARATDEQFKALKEQAIDLGAKTMFSAKQVAEAQFFLAAAGLNTDQIMKATNATLNLATAGQLELGRSAEITSNILAQFQIPAENVGNAVDVMALTVNLSTQNMEALADAMNYLGPTAKAMGMSLEEAAAITIEMSNAGLKGSLGTRALGTSIVRLTKPTDAMVDLMHELGLKFFDANGNFIGVTGTIKQLEKGFGRLNQKQRMNALSTLFGADAIQEWSILVQKGSGSLENFTNQLKNSGGAADKMAKTMQSGWAGATERMSSAWDGFLIRIGDSGLLDIATSGINFLTEQMDKLAESPEFIKFLDDMKVGLTNLKTELKPVAGFIDDIPENLKKLSEWYDKNSSWLIPLAQVVGGIALGFGVLATSIWLVNTALTVFFLITSPIFLVFLLVGLLIGLLTLLVLNWDTVKAAAVRAWEGIKDAAWKALVNLGIWFVKTILDINKKWGEIYDKGIEIWNKIKEFFAGIDLGQIGRDIIQSLINGVRSMIGAVGSVAGEVAGGLAGGVSKAMGSVGGSALSNIGGIMGRARGGSVRAGQLYEVGENNKAEMFMAGGRQFMIPGNNGEVLNQSQLMANQSQQPKNNSVIVNQNNNFTINGGNNTQAIVQQVVSVLTKQNNLANAGVGF